MLTKTYYFNQMTRHCRPLARQIVMKKFIFGILLLVIINLFLLSTDSSTAAATVANDELSFPLSTADDGDASKADGEDVSISLESEGIMRKMYTFFGRVEPIQPEDENADADEVNGGNTIQGSLRRVEEDKEKENIAKPKIYTFFQRIDEDNRSTGMSDQGDEEMLALWQEEWTAAGFETQILTLEDVMSHPRFGEFEEKLELVPLNAATRTYNHMRYYRHLAMAAVGGGYMSDYDVLPLIHGPISALANENVDIVEDGAVYLSPTELPMDFSNDEDIISYNSFVPSLISGSASKWETFAFHLLENGSQHTDEKIWTDMYAMLDLQMENKGLYKSADIVLSSFALGEEWTQESCTSVRRYIAVHFSHHIFQEAKVEIDNRAQVAKKWLEGWRSSCQSETFIQEKK